ncbi:MAG: hydroxymethylpyrimidine/phosphomethylpyrimidine kinase [Gammaproteobacteria bacterium]|nr:hydroxymethylpyrimidine/phosphomethylpyrimidine kinase [Gammaproteobacteria bacterium]
MQQPTIIMTFAGHDPCGGAGLQADIETLASLDCHATTVITALTVQDTRDVKTFNAIPADTVTAQAQAVLADMPVAAFKIGMLGSAANARAILGILQDHPNIPLVLDPVLASGSGTRLGDPELLEVITTLLVPRTTVLTPNSLEARALVPAADSLDDCAIALLEQGAEFVLLTGTHEDSPHVVNSLYQGDQLLETFTWERLPHSYHGSGCTLAAAIAGMIARGLDPFHAAHEAQEFTWNALSQGYRPGKGQHLPDRLFWARQDA